MYALPMNYSMDAISLGAISGGISVVTFVVLLGLFFARCTSNDSKTYYIPRDIIDKYYYNQNLFNNLNTALSTDNKMNMDLDDIIAVTKQKNKAEIKIRKYLQGIGKFTMSVLEDKSA